LEASRENTTDAEVCRRWGIAPHQLRVIHEHARDGEFDAFKKGPGRPKRDPDVVALEKKLQRTNKALRELANEGPLRWEVPSKFASKSQKRLSLARAAA